jgi:chromosome partitioning protein
MSKIIAILNQKGGAGKTTLATNLARALQKADNESVLLVDSDPQGSARDWNAASGGELVPVIQFLCLAVYSLWSVK